MHVYHYGVYEESALKQLMSVYATPEDEMDALLRREVSSWCSRGCVRACRRIR